MQIIKLFLKSQFHFKDKVIFGFSLRYVQNPCLKTEIRLVLLFAIGNIISAFNQLLRFGKRVHVSTKIIPINIQCFLEV
jgi:hypothetical protein